MKDFVSSHWIGVVSVASMSIVCAVLVHYGFPWTGLALVGVTMSAAVVASTKPSRSISQLIQDVEAEPRHPVSKGKRTL